MGNGGNDKSNDNDNVSSSDKKSTFAEKLAEQKRKAKEKADAEAVAAAAAKEAEEDLSDAAPIAPPPLPGAAGGAGLPPPPPPPPAKKKKSGLKRVAWTQMPRNDTQGTIFSTIDTDIELDEEELKQLFAKRKASELKKAREKEQAAASSGRISLLPMRRANNLSIVLRQFRGVSASDVVRALADLDDKPFTAQGLMALAKVVPSDDETRDVERFVKDADQDAVSRLGDAELFVLSAAKVRSHTHKAVRGHAHSQTPRRYRNWPITSKCWCSKPQSIRCWPTCALRCKM